MTPYMYVRNSDVLDGSGRRVCGKAERGEELTGAMELILTPEEAHSTVIVFIKFSTPARAALVCLRDRGREGREGRREGGRDEGKEVCFLTNAMPGNPLKIFAMMLTIAPPCFCIHSL